MIPHKLLEAGVLHVQKRLDCNYMSSGGFNLGQLVSDRVFDRNVELCCCMTALYLNPN